MTTKKTFKGHSDYVMKVTFNPKDPNTFASASSDSTIKMWSINNPLPNFTLEGHREGVNDIDFYHGLDKPFLISGSDDKSVKIWDYLLKSCVHTIERHTYSVTSVAFLPGVPFFVSGSEDGIYILVYWRREFRLYGLKYFFFIKGQLDYGTRIPIAWRLR